jgi:hypothetical protein
MEPNSGTRAIMPQGDHELMAVDSWLKPVAMMATGSAIMPTPRSITTLPSILPRGVTGTTSP